jgi:excisionase family DNA binding protein
MTLGGSAGMKYLSVNEVAKRAGMTEETIRRHIRAGKLVAHRVGKAYRITTENYHKFMTGKK